VKLVIGNRAYSSWSLRAWLAAKQSGLPFETRVVPMYGPDWDAVKHAEPDLAPSAGRVPVLWDEDAVVWDSLAIMEYLADKVGRDRFWPRDDAARAMARAMVAEMHAGFSALRNTCPMNLKRTVAYTPCVAVSADIERILTLWAQARARFGAGGPFLFGGFGAADIAFAPVAVRFAMHGIALPGFARCYVDALLGHTWLQDWTTLAREEPWVIEAFDKV